MRAARCVAPSVVPRRRCVPVSAGGEHLAVRCCLRFGLSPATWRSSWPSGAQGRPRQHPSLGAALHAAASGGGTPMSTPCRGPLVAKGSGSAVLRQRHLGVEEDFRPARREHPAILFSALDPIARRLAGAGQDMTRGRDFPLRRGIDGIDPFGTRPKFLEQIAASGRRLARFHEPPAPVQGLLTSVDRRSYQAWLRSDRASRSVRNSSDP
jgi:hypothetical protein